MALASIDAGSADIVSELTGALGTGAVQAGADIPERHLGDSVVQCPRENGPLAIAYPRDAEDVSRILALCNAHGVPVVAQGGLTGLAGGAAPVPGCVVVSLERMRAIEEIDTAASTMTVQAGTPLELIQRAADEAGLLFPLDLGARGSCAIGGNVSTNAGGNRVLRYGMTRDLVFGIEAVLADGTVITSLNKMQKNNAGYDLKQLFIGSEGTLGIITRVVLRLFPKPRSVSTALVRLPDYEAVLAFLARCKTGLGPTLSAFEAMWPHFYEIAATGGGRRPPLPIAPGIYVLCENLGADQEADQARFEALIAEAIDAGEVEDAIIAQSIRESQDIWAVRDGVTHLAPAMGRIVAFDISIPVGEFGAFVPACDAALREHFAEAKAVYFGHVADSNLHVGVAIDAERLPMKTIESIVYGTVRAWGGSISAEHGIGTMKKPYLGYSRTPAEIDVMRRIKAALDPNGIINPGKVL